MNSLTSLLLFLCAGLPLGLLGQAAYVLPSPTAAEAECTLYIDLTQCQDQRLSAMDTDAEHAEAPEGHESPITASACSPPAAACRRLP